MRYLKITSAENPNNDFIELNDFNGFLCTSFTTLGISRKLETLAVGNRQFTVDNKPEFKKYSLTIEILTAYSLYEAKYKEFITFLDRNKKSGFRLYCRPYNGMDIHYILCDIVSIAKTEKLQPITLTVTQNSLWLGEDKKVETQQIFDSSNNIFEFKQKENDGYYCVEFKQKENDGYYCVEFSMLVQQRAEFEISCYNEIPLNLKIYGACNSPYVALFKKDSLSPFFEVAIDIEVDNQHYIEINSHINENGIWLVSTKTGNKLNIEDKVLNKYGSPYLYLSKGEYYIKIQDNEQNNYITQIFFNEEYSE